MRLRRDDGAEVHLGDAPERHRAGRDVAAHGRAAQRHRDRALDGALVYEVGRRQYEPILAARPELVNALERAMEERLRLQGEFLERYDAERARAGFKRRIGRLLART